MDLLPKVSLPALSDSTLAALRRLTPLAEQSNAEYGTQEYWNARYAK